MNIFETIESNDPDTLEKLILSNKVDVNKKDTDGSTPLHYACEYGYLTIVELLLNHPKIDVNIQDEDGDTPLFLACNHMYSYFGETSEIVELLLQHPDIDVNIKNKYGWTPLHSACSWGSNRHADNQNHKIYIEVVKSLLAHPDIDVNAENDDGETPLYLAYSESGYSQDKNSKLLRLLLSHPKIKIDFDYNIEGINLIAKTILKFHLKKNKNPMDELLDEI